MARPSPVVNLPSGFTANRFVRRGAGADDCDPRENRGITARSRSYAVDDGTAGLHPDDVLGQRPARRWPGLYSKGFVARVGTALRARTGAHQGQRVAA